MLPALPMRGPAACSVLDSSPLYLTYADDIAGLLYSSRDNCVVSKACYRHRSSQSCKQGAAGLWKWDCTLLAILQLALCTTARLALAVSGQAWQTWRCMVVTCSYTLIRTATYHA